MSIGQRLRRLELAFNVKPALSDQVSEEEFQFIIQQDSEAITLMNKGTAIIHDAVKDHPDREALQVDEDRLLAAMDIPSRERLIECMDAVNARVDLLRKKPACRRNL